MSEKEPVSQSHPSVVVPGGEALLSEGQRRSLETVLRRMEWVVWQTEELLMKDEFPELVLTRVMHLPDSLQQDALLRLMLCIRRELASLATTCGIVAQEEDHLRTLHALFTSLWTDLEAVQPSHEQIRPGIEHLLDLTLAVADVVNGTRSPHAARALIEAYENERTQNTVDVGEEERHDRSHVKNRGEEP